MAALSDTPLNFDPDSIVPTAAGWTTTDLRQPLPRESPGPPVENGSWEIARRLMAGYEFADPSIVRAYYDPELPLQGRNMLLKLKALRIAHLYVGVRVADVYDQTRELAEGRARVWGWSYQTLQGHVEQGQMHWEVWKWVDDGRIEFRVHSVSRPAPIPNPIVRVGFHLMRERERETFLQSTKRRMLAFTEIGLRDHDGDSIRAASARLTSRSISAADRSHTTLADNARPPQRDQRGR